MILSNTASLLLLSKHYNITKLKALKISLKVLNKKVVGNLDFRIKACLRKLESLKLMVEVVDLAQKELEDISLVRSYMSLFDVVICRCLINIERCGLRKGM